MCKWVRDKLRWLPSGLYVPNDNPEGRSFIQHMQDSALPFIAARTVVLYGVTEVGDPYILGTGVPLHSGAFHFILTAAHIFDELKEKEAAVYIRPGSDGGRLMPIDPLRIIRSAMPPSGIRVADQFDVCVVE